MELILGIDPGANGGWAIINGTGLLIAKGRYEERAEITAFRGMIAVACIEKMVFRRADLAGGKAWGINKLRENFGLWRGLCEAWDIPVVKEVMPKSWKLNYRLVLHGAGRFLPPHKIRKLKSDMAINLANRIWPEAGIMHDGVAVGLLLAEYARQRLQILPGRYS